MTFKKVGYSPASHLYLFCCKHTSTGDRTASHRIYTCFKLDKRGNWTGDRTASHRIYTCFKPFFRQPLAVFLEKPKFKAATFTATAFELFFPKMRLTQTLNSLCWLCLKRFYQKGNLTGDR
ncbi:hypothetical protein VB735_25370 [Halotia wernerae UHCC 0503]|nr:hypothetical protein [Halotia wernerae UHCC 0503]